MKFFHFIIVALYLVPCVFAQYQVGKRGFSRVSSAPPPFPTTGLLAYYDDVQGTDATVLYDKSGNGNNGLVTSSGTSSSTTWSSQGLVYNGVGNCSNGPVGGTIFGSSTVTAASMIVAYKEISHSGTAHPYYEFVAPELGGAGDGQMGIVNWGSTAGNGIFAWFQPTGSESYTYEAYMAGYTPPPDSTWHVFGFTWTGGSSANIYFDGVKQTATDYVNGGGGVIPPSIHITNSRHNLGCDLPGGSLGPKWANTTLATSLLYNRVLSDSEMSSIFSTLQTQLAARGITIGSPVTLPSAAAIFLLNDNSAVGSGTGVYATVADTSGNGVGAIFDGVNTAGYCPGGYWYSDSTYGVVGCFDGANQYVYVSGSAAPLQNINNDLSLTSYVNIPSYKTEHSVMLGSDSGGPGWGSSLSLDASGHVVFYIVTGGAGYSATSTSTISTNAWHSIAGVREAGTLKVYIDGTLAGSSSAPTGAVRSYGAGMPSMVGKFTSPDGSQFLGHMRDIRYYGVALTAAQVAFIAGH